MSTRSELYGREYDQGKGHSEPIVTGLLIGEKSVGKPGVVILCKATCDWLIIKMN